MCLLCCVCLLCCLAVLCVLQVTRQEATLLAHEADPKHGRAIKLAFEVSHVCYFPNLLFHACWEQAVAGTSFAEKVKRADKKEPKSKRK